MDASPPDNSTQTMGSALIEMNAARQSVVVKAPIDEVYEQWSRVEDLPKFITPLRNVRRLDDARFSYTWNPNDNEQQGTKNTFDLRSAESVTKSGRVSRQFQTLG
jgi:uncharacterized membrane protein